jgi:hypothetical protein
VVKLQRILFKNVVRGCALMLGFKDRAHGYLLMLKFKENFKGNFQSKI